MKNANRNEVKKAHRQYGRLPAGTAVVIEEYDESLVRRLIEKVTVYENKFTVEFKSGVTVDVDE